MIVGDINIDLLKNPSNSVSCNSIYDVITRVISGTLFDHVLCNFYQGISISNGTVKVDFSDQSAVFTQVSMKVKQRSDPFAKKIANCDFMRESLSTKLHEFSVLSYNDPNSFLNDFVSIFKIIFNECTVSEIRSKESKDDLCPWMI